MERFRNVSGAFGSVLGTFANFWVGGGALGVVWQRSGVFGNVLVVFFDRLEAFGNDSKRLGAS